MRCRIEQAWPQIANAFALPLDQFFGRHDHLRDEGAMSHVEREAMRNVRRAARRARRTRDRQHG